MADKYPWFKFCPADWLNDTELQAVSFQTRGVWIQMLARMWGGSVRGELKGTLEEIRRQVGCTKKELKLFFFEQKTFNFCDVFEQKNGSFLTLLIVNRRMIRDQKDRENNALYQERHREKQKSKGKSKGESKGVEAKKLEAKNIEPPNPLPKKGEKRAGKGQQKKDIIPVKQIWELYQEICVPPFSGCGKETISGEDSQIRKNIYARWRASSERRTLEWWESYFRNCLEFPFLCAETDQCFRASLLFVTYPGNMSKIESGFYQRRSAPTAQHKQAIEADKAKTDESRARREYNASKNQAVRIAIDDMAAKDAAKLKELKQHAWELAEKEYPKDEPLIDRQATLKSAAELHLHGIFEGSYIAKEFESFASWQESRGKQEGAA